MKLLIKNLFIQLVLSDKERGEIHVSQDEEEEGKNQADGDS